MAGNLNDTKAHARDALDDKKFVFAGNRYTVLEEMIERRLAVEILAVEGSYLERALREKGMAFIAIRSKEQLVSMLETMAYDYFVANGCPYILPVSRLQKHGRTFINVHPGPLPDLRGADPVPGALLLGRDSGAACHIMDDGIDTGPLISRVIVPNTDELDAGLLYQISFMAEREAFALAYARAFRPAADPGPASTSTYYSRKEEDLVIDFGEPADAIVRRIRAFSNRSQGARFVFGGLTFRVFDAEYVQNPYLMEKCDSYTEGEVVFRYENCLLVRKGEAFLKLKAVEGDLSVIRPGDRLGHTQTGVGSRMQKAPAAC